MTSLTDTNLFGQWLQKHRKQYDLTRADLAEHIACSESTIYKIEAGLIRPSKQLAALLARYFEIPDADHPRFIQFARGVRPSLSNTDDAPTRPDPTLRQVTSVAPPPRGDIPPTIQVPAERTPFFGREAEAVALKQLVGRADVRLITIVGPGGVGKTRLAVHTARTVLSDLFPDGIVFVNLALIKNPELLLSTIAAASNIPADRSRPIREVLAEALEGRSMLIILDNLEHLLPAAAEIADLLNSTTTIKLLITSRIRLRLSGEHIFSLATLPLPPTGQSVTPALLVANPAVDLFLQRASAAIGTIALTDENAATIAEICCRLDGLPLAIELAATQCHVLPPELLLKRLSHRLELLTGGYRDALLHHQSLRATIAWSYDLLTPDHQLLLHIISLFRGGGRVEHVSTLQCWFAARQRAEQPQQHATDRDTIRCLAATTTLVDHHLAYCQTDPDATPRFFLLESIGEFAREKIEELGQEHILTMLYCEFFLAYVERRAERLSSSEEELILRELDQEWNNLHAAIQWLVEYGRPEMVARFTNGLLRYLTIRGLSGIAQRWLTPTLLEALQDPQLAARTQRTAGCLAFELNEYTQSSALFASAIDGFRALNDPAELAETLCQAGLLARSHGHLQEARAMLEESMELFTQLDHGWGIAQALNNLGVVMRWLGDAETAQRMYTESLRRFREVGSQRACAMPLNNLGVLAMRTHQDSRAALQFYDEALSLFRAVDDRPAVAMTLNNIGCVLLSQGQLEQSEHILNESLQLFRGLGNSLGSAAVRSNLAEIAWRQRRLTQAWQLAQAVLRTYAKMDMQQSIQLYLYEMAYIAYLSHLPALAVQLYSAATAAASRSNAPQPPENQAHIDQLVQDTRTQLTDEIWQQSWEIGQTTALEHIVQGVLELSAPGEDALLIRPTSGRQLAGLTAPEPADRFRQLTD